MKITVNSPSTATILIPSFSALATALLGCSRTNNQHLQQQKTISIQFSPRWNLRAQESPHVFKALGIHFFFLVIFSPVKVEVCRDVKCFHSDPVTKQPSLLQHPFCLMRTAGPLEVRAGIWQKEYEFKNVQHPVLFNPFFPL